MSEEIEDLACEYCGRCVLAGPPCCNATRAIFDAQTLAAKEVEHARACQSRADKGRAKLQARVSELEAKLDASARADAQGIAAAWEQANNYLEMYQVAQRELDDRRGAIAEVRAFGCWGVNRILDRVLGRHGA